MKKMNCMWSHCCGETRVCCSYCNKKNCVWRCNDNSDKCPYAGINVEIDTTDRVETVSTKIRLHNEVVSADVRTKLLKYKKDNKLRTENLSEKIGVSTSILSKILSSEATTRIRSDSYNKIKEFVIKNKTTGKRKLW